MSHILNQLILQRIEQNDDTLTHFRIGHGHIFTLKPAEAEFASCVNNNYTRLGNAIATNTHINILEIGLVGNPLNITNRKFFDGIKQNSSIHHLSLCCGDTDQQHVLVDGVGHEILKVYRNNTYLTKLEIYSAELQNNGVTTITSTLRTCSNLTALTIRHCGLTDEQLLIVVRGN